jgi:cyclopropane fatty-acyl-phospholipid synthase-like methyltransferase
MVARRWLESWPVTSTSDGHAREVRRYYDDNTTPFEKLGQGGASIHRAVWAPGVTTRAAAMHHVDELLLSTLDGQRPTVVDLGCGLGASLLYLASRTDLVGEGITISPRQVARATELIAAAGATDRVRCREGNYLALPEDLVGTADLAFSIEAFVHSPDADGYFREAARSLRHAGRIVICDDFLASPEPPASRREARWLAEFRAGWHVASLLTVDQVSAIASAHGLHLVRDVDLTPYLELRRPRDRVITALVGLGRRWGRTNAFWQSLVGGNALQLALTRGLLQYRFLEFTRSAEQT